MKKIKAMIIDICKKNVVFRKMIRFFRLFFKKLNYLKYKLKYKVDDKTIFFEVYDGRNYTCSPKAIYEKMLTMKEFKDFKFIWAFNDPSKHDVMKDKRLVIVKTNTKDYYKYISSSKYWIVNSIMDECITKKKGQVYVQCWHGTPLKRLRYDIEVNGAVLNTIEEIRKRNDRDAVKFDYFISPSKYCTEKFTSAFNLIALGKKNIIIEEGYPRNDSLFNRGKKDIDKIKDKLGIPKDKKVICYLPTFRDNQHTSGVGYTYNLAIDFDSLKKRFGKDYVILFKPHYFIANKIDLSKYKNFVYNVANYDEINDIYLASDLLITDYSSVFFDYANLNRPVMFYMYDFDDYKNNLRDFYISLDELPGPIAKTQKELEDYIVNIDKSISKYKKTYDKFNDKYNYLDDGNASERVIRVVFDNLFKK
ncbi:MAG: CDP-glycerol glycerophosphotransferase family protein [Tenericutes bacterium]|nr:CDP-glycerol glycerophosphotransferase family protein [Mycoplasmatota bacterium]